MEDCHRQTDPHGKLDCVCENSLELYLSPPGRSPTLVRTVFVFVNLMDAIFILRPNMCQGDFEISPQVERVSLRVLHGLLRAGFGVAGLLEIQRSVVRPAGVKDAQVVPCGALDSVPGTG